MRPSLTTFGDAASVNGFRHDANRGTGRSIDYRPGPPDQRGGAMCGRSVGDSAGLLGLQDPPAEYDPSTYHLRVSLLFRPRRGAE